MGPLCAIWARVSTDEQETGYQLAELARPPGRRGRGGGPGAAGHHGHRAGG